MLIDTHCHLQQITKYSFDAPLEESDFVIAQEIIAEAAQYDVATIINVGTNLIESKNSIELAKRNKDVFATIGIHPNDLKENWLNDIEHLSALLAKKNENKIVGIGECGLDTHYPDYDLSRQKEAFIAQINLALDADLALVVHTRQAPQDTLDCLRQFKNRGLFGTIHCFSEDLYFAKQAIDLGFVLGIGGTITYPKNEQVRSVVKAVGLDHLVLETDAPFLPPQQIRGKQNRPFQINTIAHYIAELLDVPFEQVAEVTTRNAQRIFKGITTPV